MKKKSLILLIAFIIISISTVCFGSNVNNDIKNTVNGATNTVVDGSKNLITDAKNGLQNAGNSIGNVAGNIGTAISDGINNMGNMENTNYTATRTSTEETGSAINTTDATTLTWIAVIIAGIVIVGLVWYYASQRTESKH